MSVGEGGETLASAWFECFPFVGRFDQIVDADVSFEYADRLICVLDPAIDVLVKMVKEPTPPKAVVASLFFSVAARARLQVADAYRAEITGSEAYDRRSVLGALEREWKRLVLREQIVTIQYSDDVGEFLGESVRDLWMSHAVVSMLSAEEVVSVYGPAVSHLKVVAIGEVLVEHQRGKFLRQLSPHDRVRSVLPIAAYRSLLDVVRASFDKKAVPSPSAVSDAAAEVEGLSFGELGVLRVADWLWLILSSVNKLQGYCYHLLFEPRRRFSACEVLGSNPLASEVLWYYQMWGGQWADHRAVVEAADSFLHVVVAGSADVHWLTAHGDKRIGMDVARSEPVDYFARALVDDFLAKHRPVKEQPVVAPVDAELGALSLDTSAGTGRGFVDVASALYAAVGEVLSPRVEDARRLATGMIDNTEHVSERDSQRVKDVYSRLNDGPVIDELYFRRSRRRFVRQRSRPRLDESSGRSFHVFGGFPADGGGGTGAWQRDDDWDIPGWRSYLAVFDPGTQRTVSFSCDDDADDIRMDCTGEGAIEFGDCKVATSGTVLWFSRSVKFKVVTASIVDLRISIPDVGSALAVGLHMRRYMHVPGYVVVARSFDVVTSNPTLLIPVNRIKRTALAGCVLYSGRKFVERGRHRFKLSQLASGAPVKMILKTEPIQALKYVSICGMRLKPRAREYVSVLFDHGNADTFVVLDEEADVVVSAMQVVRLAEFDLTVASTRDAR